MNSTAVLCAVRILSETVAQLPLLLYRRLETRGKEREDKHPLSEILSHLPNPEISSFQWRETAQMHLTLWGNHYSEIVRDGYGRIRELWPLTPWRVNPERKNGELVYRVQLDNEQKLWPADKIFHVAGLSWGGIKGMSLIGLAREAIGLSLATEAFGARFFGNDARPSLLLKYPGVVSENMGNNILKSWQEDHGPLDKKWRVRILEEGMDVKEVGIPPEDAQFLATRKFQISEIARVTRIPLHMLSDLDRATFNNLEEMGSEFVIYTMLPWLKRWEQAIYRQLLTPVERKTLLAEFLIEGLQRGNTQTRYQAYATGRQWGWLSPNDIREKENLNPVEGGDVYLQPLNMVPAGTNVLADRMALLEHELRALPEHAPVTHRSSAGRERLATAHKPIIRATTVRIIRREQADVMRQAKKIFNRSEAQFDAWLEEFYEGHRAYIKEQMYPALIALAELSAAEAADEVEFDGDQNVDEFMDSYIEAYTARHVGSSIGQLKSVAGNAIADGEDPVSALQTRFDEWDERRPDKTAEWESRQVMNAISSLIFVRAGLGLLWHNTSIDPCPYCQAMNGKRISGGDKFLGLGESFQPEGTDTPFIPSTSVGHPPLHGGCQCVILPG